jgi:hypothetical protein
MVPGLYKVITGCPSRNQDILGYQVGTFYRAENVFFRARYVELVRWVMGEHKPTYPLANSHSYGKSRIEIGTSPINGAFSMAIVC